MTPKNQADTDKSMLYKQKRLMVDFFLKFLSCFRCCIGFRDIF